MCEGSKGSKYIKGTKSSNYCVRFSRYNTHSILNIHKTFLYSLIGNIIRTPQHTYWLLINTLTIKGLAFRCIGLRYVVSARIDLAYLFNQTK